MLKRFEVMNVKNFKDRFVLDFADVHDYRFNVHCVKNGLLKDAIIYGKNATGKSNFGLALFDVVATLTDDNVGFYRNKYSNFFLNADNDLPYGEFVYVFQIDTNEVMYAYRKSDIDTIVAEKFVVNGKCFYDIFFDEQGVVLHGSSELGVSNPASLMQEYKPGEISFLRYLIKNTYLDENSVLKKLYSFVSGMMWVRSFENNQLIPSGQAKGSVSKFLCDNDLVEEYSNFLREFGIENEILVETQLDGKKALYFRHAHSNISVFESASSGTLALTTLFFALHLGNSKTFLWMDEFDAFYHFELAEKVITYLARNFDFQVVCTSHNTDLLSNRIMRPDCYFVLNKARIISLPNATDRELREGHNLEKMFQTGEFEDIDEET